MGRRNATSLPGSNGPPQPPKLLLQYQSALAASEARFRNLIEQSADAFLVVCPDGTIRYVNPAAEVLLGRSSKQLLGQSFGTPVVPGENTEVDLVHPGSPGRVAEMRASAITWEDQPAYLASLRDITARKQTEETLRRLVVDAQEADRRKGEFLAMLGHELRNPLGSIRTALEIFRHGRTDPEYFAPTLDLMQRQVGHMARLLDDLLDMARITHGKIQLRLEPVDLVQVIRSAVEAGQTFLASRRHELRMMLPVEPVPVNGDSTRLEQVLANLLHNAAKYTEPGGRIELTCTRQGDRAVVKVRDTGIGIPLEHLPRVFDLFTQVEARPARTEGGLGIGLNLVRSLVQMHGGQVEACSAGRGQGSEFRVLLPLADGPAARLAVAAPVETPTGPRRVLLVEDNDAHRELLQKLLQMYGHQVTVAENGPRGLEELLTKPFDLALVDLGLPGMNGLQLAQRLQGTPQRRRLRLVALTGYGQPEDRRQALEAGFDLHLVKPVDLAALEQLLHQAPPLAF